LVETELDGSDPAWRWVDLETQRIEIADAENAALVILDAASLLPRGWPAPSPGNVPLEGLGSTDITAEVTDLPPPRLPDKRQADRLRIATDQASDTLVRASALTKFHRGRFPNQINPGNPFAANRDFGAEARLVASVLQTAMSWRLVEQDYDGAALCCRNLLAAARAFGDEGTIIHQLARLAIAASAARSLERLLAQGQYPDAILADLQQLAKEARQAGSLINVLRWERAYQHELLTSMTANRPSGSRPPDLWGRVQEALSKDNLRHHMSRSAVVKNHARVLSYTTALIEWLKQPSPDRQQRLAQMQGEATAASRENDPYAVDAVLFVQVVVAWEKFVERWLRNEALLVTAETAVAAERYRLRHGDWPESFEQLAPDFLAAVPGDPYLQGSPIRVKRVADGLVIYSVGPDRQDDGGNLLRVGPPWRGKDIGGSSHRTRKSRFGRRLPCWARRASKR
jgi:hypothetical protein